MIISETMNHLLTLGRIVTGLLITIFFFFISLQSDVELIYKFSPLLMQYIPKETVALWISRRDTLAPMKLIPALVQYDHNKYREQVSILSRRR